jgi:putative redox protein
MPILKPAIYNASGDRLGAQLDLPLEGRPRAYAIFAHCFTCTKNIKAAAHISRSLTRQRIAVLRFDFTGLGESEGDFTETTFTSNVSDLVAVAEYLEEEFEPAQLLIGHSLGGSAALQAAHQIPSVVGVVTIAAPFETAHLARLLADTRSLADDAGEARVTIGGTTFRLKRQFFEDLERTNMRRAIQTLERALLVMHSPEDATVDIENAMEIFTAARHPKSFVSLDNANHLLSEQRDSWYAGEVIAAWAGRYLSPVAEIAQTSPMPASAWMD